MAFAASDTHAAVRPDWEPLSCEYAYYHALQYDNGAPGDGTTLSGMLTAIAQDGQPYEADWPYLSALPSDLTKWQPPTTVGQLFRRSSEQRLATELYTLLDSGFTGYRSHDALKRRSIGQDLGALWPAMSRLVRARRHAVIAVGYGRQGSERFVLVRNSWGDAVGYERLCLACGVLSHTTDYRPGNHEGEDLRCICRSNRNRPVRRLGWQQ